jgi:hypothetical protein
MEINYTTHFNWNWIVESSIFRLKRRFAHQHSLSDDSLTITNPRFRDLLSAKVNSKEDKKLKPKFALFRVEIMYRDVLSYVWADSQAFSFLDAKDSLYRHLLDVHKAHLMPGTIMIPWDTFDRSQLLELISAHAQIHGQGQRSVDENQLPFRKCLLKAALGAGGFGLYFVDSIDDIIAVIRAHAKRASKYEGFLEELASSNAGSIPNWSLQRYIYTIESKANSCKTQVRAYVVKRGSKLYAYRQYEVRMPYWTTTSDDDSDGYKLKNVAEEELVGDGKAVPYNHHRNKEETNRMLLEEVEELVDAASAIHKVVIEAFLGLQTSITSQNEESATEIDEEQHLAIAAIDLVVERCSSDDDEEDACSSRGYRAYILELNSNPAIAGEKKRMSDRYREHLQRFVTSLMVFGLALQRRVDHSDDDEHLSEEMFELII